jgi:hypothetical protein
MKRRALLAIALVLAVVVTGCTGAGPAAGTASGRPRCASGARDDQRPLFFLFCVESP